MNIKSSHTNYLLIVFFALLWTLSSCERKEIKKEFYPSGKIHKEYQMVRGHRDGDFIEYSEVGDTLKTGKFRNDKLDGSVSEYYRGNLLKTRYTYEGGDLNGRAVGYYESGQLQFTTDYRNNSRIGWLTHYFDNPNKLIKEKKLYNDKGKLVHLKKFDNDGAVIYNQILPYIISMDDTIKIGEEIRLELIFDYPIPTTTVYFGIPGEHFSLKDTFEVRVIKNKGRNEFNFTPAKSGRHKVGFLFLNEAVKGDSTNLNDIFPSHGIFVSDGS